MLNWIATIFLMSACLAGGVSYSTVAHGLANKNATEPFKSYQDGDMGLALLLASVPAFLLGHHVLGYLCVGLGLVNFGACGLGLWKYARKNNP